MASYTAKAHVARRNEIGQFTREIKNAGNRTVETMVEEGARLSVGFAPTGVKHDRRTLPLKQSIVTKMHGRTNGSWGSTARHALPIELGARPHPIIGDPFVKFFWEAAGRMWIPGLFGSPDIINHPGNDAQPFLQPALTLVMSRWRQIAGRFYPG